MFLYNKYLFFIIHLCQGTVEFSKRHPHNLLHIQEVATGYHLLQIQPPPLPELRVTNKVDQVEQVLNLPACKEQQHQVHNKDNQEESKIIENTIN